MFVVFLCTRFCVFISQDLVCITAKEHCTTLLTLKCFYFDAFIMMLSYWCPHAKNQKNKMINFGVGNISTFPSNCFTVPNHTVRRRNCGNQPPIILYSPPGTFCTNCPPQPCHHLPPQFDSIDNHQRPKAAWDFRLPF